MGFITTSKKFYDAFTGDGGGGVDYFNGCIGDKMKCVVEGYFKWSVEGKRMVFDATGKTITLTNELDASSFIAEGFKVDDEIDVVDSALNDGTFTITKVEARTLTVAESVVNETAESASVFGTTLVTAIDYYYNLIENNEAANYISKTDKGSLQRYTAGGLDASVATPVYAYIGTDSNGWVTEILTDEVSELKIEGVSIADYKQSFKITQTFYVAPLWNLSLFNNYASRKAPDYFTNGKRLKYICQIDGKYDLYSPEVGQTGTSATPSGKSSWLNQNAIGNRPEYYVQGITYADDDTEEVYPKLVANKNVLVSITIKSRTGQFVDATSKLILKHLLTPLTESEFVNTTTTMLQNLKYDEAVITLGAAATNGINFGTDYQVLTDIEAVLMDAETAFLTFVVKYSDPTIELLRVKPDTDRYYAFIVSCQDEDITTTKNIDRVNVLCDYQTANFDFINDELFALVDYIHCFPFPNIVANEKNSVAGYQGDLVITKTGFKIETDVVADVSPTLQKVTVQIVATKTDNKDFIIEEKAFNVSTERKLNDIQTINIEDDRGFVLAEDSPWNVVSLKRNSDYDSGTMIGYDLQYGFALRFETWLEVVQSASGLSYDIFKNVESVVQAWKRYSDDVNDWDLKYRLTFDIAGYDGFVTQFQTETDIVVLDETDAPEAGETFTATIKYFDDSTNDKYEIDGIIKDATTRIQVEFLGDVTLPAGMSQFWGSLFASNNPSGSVFNRRFACSEFDSEEDSPFSTEDLPTSGAIEEWESANLRIGIFADRVRIDTYYTDSSDNKNAQLSDIFFCPRIGYTPAYGIGEMEIGKNFIIS